MKIKKILVYLWNKFFDIKISVTNKLLIFKDSIFSRFQKTPSIKSIEETINYIIENRASVSRYGDGEFKLAYGKSISFQKSNKELQRRLKEVLLVEEKNFTVCIQDIFESRVVLHANNLKVYKNMLMNLGHTGDCMWLKIGRSGMNY